VNCHHNLYALRAACHARRKTPPLSAHAGAITPCTRHLYHLLLYYRSPACCTYRILFFLLLYRFVSWTSGTAFGDACLFYGSKHLRDMLRLLAGVQTGTAATSLLTRFNITAYAICARPRVCAPFSCRCAHSCLRLCLAPVYHAAPFSCRCRGCQRRQRWRICACAGCADGRRLSPSPWTVYHSPVWTCWRPFTICGSGSRQRCSWATLFGING